MDITQGQVEHLARLARLTLTPEEGAALRGRLEEMVGYLQQLAQAEGGAEGPVCPAPLRPDGMEPSLETGELLAQAPQTRDGYVCTPRSVGEGGGA